MILIQTICTNGIALNTGNQGMYSADIAALAPVLKSAIKPKPNLLAKALLKQQQSFLLSIHRLGEKEMDSYLSQKH